MGWEFFSSPPRPDRLWGYPASYPMGTRGSLPGGKGPGREADDSPPSSAEIKNS